GRTRVPDLRRKTAGGGVEVVETNERKSEWMVEEFYPVRGPSATDPPDVQYPEPNWRSHPISQRQLQLVVDKMKPWKATRSGTFPNCVYKLCAKLLLPRLCNIYRGLDVYRHEPDDWKRTETIVAHKPGKPDYTVVGAHRPFILSHGHARVRNAVKNFQITTNAERYGMLPANHYGG
ncbi:hypothetical protein B0H16DRAFT_1222171, partial [Mycena metata]